MQATPLSQGGTIPLGRDYLDNQRTGKLKKERARKRMEAAAADQSTNDIIIIVLVLWRLTSREGNKG